MAQMFALVPQHCSTMLDYALKIVLTNCVKHRIFKEHCQLKKDVQLESCELSFIWGKMRTAAQEATSHIALRDYSKAAVGESQYIRFW